MALPKGITNAVPVSGDAEITGVKTFTQTIVGTAAAAEKLATARTITLSGAASGSISFDGSADATLEVSIGGNQGAVIGEVRWFAMSTPPEGWLVCNGAAVSTSDYAALFAAIGNTFLPEDVSASPTTFNLPNLIGKVPWGTSSQVGTKMEAGLPNIAGDTGSLNWSDNDNNALDYDTWLNHSGPYERRLFAINGEHIAPIYTQEPGLRRVLVNFDASRSNPIYGRSGTVQPPALCLLPCIRYE